MNGQAGKGDAPRPVKGETYRSHYDEIFGQLLPCANCYGGHQKPCQWCGDSGVVRFKPRPRLPG